MKEENINVCPSCGAHWHDNVTCEDHFRQMLAWDFSDAQAGAVHHLTVLCYHLQHPHLLSQEGLVGQMELLRLSIEEAYSPSELRAYNRPLADNATRKTPISARPDNIGAYKQPIAWSMTCSYVTEIGLEGYPDRVRQWASSVMNTLRAVGKSNKSMIIFVQNNQMIHLI